MDSPSSRILGSEFLAGLQRIALEERADLPLKEPTKRCRLGLAQGAIQDKVGARLAEEGHRLLRLLVLHGEDACPALPGVIEAQDLEVLAAIAGG